MGEIYKQSKETVVWLGPDSIARMFCMQDLETKDLTGHPVVLNERAHSLVHEIYWLAIADVQTSGNAVESFRKSCFRINSIYTAAMDRHRGKPSIAQWKISFISTKNLITETPNPKQGFVESCTAVQEQGRAKIQNPPAKIMAQQGKCVTILRN